MTIKANPAFMAGECTPQKFMDDAISSTGYYLLRMRTKINEEFGEGYAEKNPELLGAAISACAIEFATGILNQKADDIITHLVQQYSETACNDAGVGGDQK